MEKILLNLALIHLTNFCKENNIDCSGTHINKIMRKFTYSLVHEKTGEAIAFVTFHKSGVPTYQFAK